MEPDGNGRQFSSHLLPIHSWGLVSSSVDHHWERSLDWSVLRNYAQYKHIFSITEARLGSSFFFYQVHGQCGFVMSQSCHLIAHAWPSKLALCYSRLSACYPYFRGDTYSSYCSGLGYSSFLYYLLPYYSKLTLSGEQPVLPTSSQQSLCLKHTTSHQQPWRWHFGSLSGVQHPANPAATQDCSAGTVEWDKINVILIEYREYSIFIVIILYCSLTKEGPLWNVHPSPSFPSEGLKLIWKTPHLAQA